jgi:hypothetical protein
MFKVTFPSGRTVTPALIVIDMQNGFVSKGVSYVNRMKLKFGLDDD